MTRSNQSAMTDAFEFGAGAVAFPDAAAAGGAAFDCPALAAVERGEPWDEAPTVDEPGARAFPFDTRVGDEVVDCGADGVLCDAVPTPAAAGASLLVSRGSQSRRRSCCRSTKPTVTAATASTNVTKPRQCIPSASARPRTRRHAPHSMQRGAKPLIGRPQRRHRTIGIRRTGEVHYAADPLAASVSASRCTFGSTGA